MIDFHINDISFYFGKDSHWWLLFIRSSQWLLHRPQSAWPSLWLLVLIYLTNRFNLPSVWWLVKCWV